MLRELADALEVFTRRRTLVLALEDLQWSDRSTVDLLAYLARRREPARLLIIGSVRAAELIVRQHPLHGLIQEWRANAQCEALALELLGRDDVAAYLATRFAGAAAGGVDARRRAHSRPQRGQRVVHGEHGQRPRRARAPGAAQRPLACAGIGPGGDRVRPGRTAGS